MANGEQAVNIDVKTSGAKAAAKEAKTAAKEVLGLSKIVQKLSGAFSKAFSPEKVVDFFRSAIQSSGALDKELLVMRLALGKLKAAIGDAVAPMGAVLIPIINQAIWAATRLVKAVGQVIAALFGQGNAAKTAAQNQTALAKANDKAKKSLAGFDEINQLDTADSEETAEATAPATEDTLTPQLQPVVEKILSLIQPLKEIDFAPAVAAFGRLKEAIAPIGQALFAGLEWAWHNLLVPLAAWTIEDLLPVFLETLASALGVLNAVIVALQPGATWLWETFLQPIAQWTGEIIIQALQWLSEKLEVFGEWIRNNQSIVEVFALALGSFATGWTLVNTAVGIWESIGTVATAVTTAFGVAANTATGTILLVAAAIAAVIAIVVLLVKNWDTVKATAIQVWEAIKSAWGNAWSWFKGKILDPLVNGFKTVANGIIGFLNGLIAGAVSAVNGIVRALNKLNFTVPDWVPGLGGKTLGFQLKELNTPKIPYLARGAVLPANKPFMAVLGDQKHGTNIEAPLDTIKQALAEVLAVQDSETVVQVNFTGSLAQLARVLKPEIDIESRRRGGSLAKGATF